MAKRTRVKRASRPKRIKKTIRPAKRNAVWYSFFDSVNKKEVSEIV